MKTYQNVIAGITLAFGLLCLCVLRYEDAGAGYYILPGLTVVVCGTYFALPMCYDNTDKSEANSECVMHNAESNDDINYIANSGAERVLTSLPPRYDFMDNELTTDTHPEKIKIQYAAPKRKPIRAFTIKVCGRED